jgi:hypothetical protein
MDTMQTIWIQYWVLDLDLAIIGQPDKCPRDPPRHVVDVKVAPRRKRMPMASLDIATARRSAAGTRARPG